MLQTENGLRNIGFNQTCKFDSWYSGFLLRVVGEFDVKQDWHTYDLPEDWDLTFTRCNNAEIHHHLNNTQCENMSS
jgi:hypothetical protein